MLKTNEPSIMKRHRGSVKAHYLACGRSQARGWIGSVAAGLHHSNAGSKPSLRPTPQLMATLKPFHCLTLEWIFFPCILNKSPALQSWSGICLSSKLNSLPSPPCSSSAKNISLLSSCCLTDFLLLFHSRSGLFPPESLNFINSCLLTYSLWISPTNLEAPWELKLNYSPNCHASVTQSLELSTQRCTKDGAVEAGPSGSGNKRMCLKTKETGVPLVAQWLAHRLRQRIEPASLWILTGFVSTEPQRDLLIYKALMSF